VTSAISGSGTPAAPTTTGPTASAVTGSGGVITQSISGLGSGLDTNAIVSQLVAAQRANREGPVKSQISAANAQLIAYAQIQVDTTTLQSAARALATPTAWNALTAVSSNPNAVVVTAGNGSSIGNLSFTVDALATAGSVRSNNVLTSTATAVAADSAILLATGGQALGFSTFGAGDTLSVGSHAIIVTQSSVAATKLGSAALGASTTIDGTNDTLQVSVDGNPFTLTLAHGSYTPAQLATAINAAATSAGAPLTASVDATTGKLQLASNDEGSTASLQVTGGNALTALSLSVDGAALTGVDGRVQLDGGVEQTITNVTAGQSMVLTGPNGPITAVFSGGLRAGTVNAVNVSTGDGSLATVVSNINTAGAGVIASAVQVGVNQYRLQLTSAKTGVLNDLNVSSSEFNAGAGGLVSVNAAADAKLTIGSGAGAFQVTSGTNTLSGLMPGVTLTLVGTTSSTSPVTISSAHDVQGLAAKVQSLVDAANALHQTIQSVTAFDTTTNHAQPLTGDFATTQLSLNLATAMEDAVSGATPVSPNLAGVSADKTGAFKFDQATFIAAYNADPSGMAKLFQRGGASTNPDVSFISAADMTAAGSYAVNVTQLATQATSTGLTGTWPTGVDSSVLVRVGSKQISFAVKGTDTQAEAVNGLNDAFAHAGLALQAGVSGGGIAITSVGYGHNATFDVAWDGVNYATFAGTDVAGTINGVTASGNGQQLLIPFDTPGSGGLALNITGTATGNLGTFVYSPGIAQRIDTAIAKATDAISGSITISQNDLNTRIKSFNQDIADMELQIAQYQQQLQMEFTNMETVISGLKTTSDQLTNALSQLPAFSQH
jgi:flagellar hook-associated protein 2